MLFGASWKSPETLRDDFLKIGGVRTIDCAVYPITTFLCGRLPEIFESYKKGWGWNCGCADTPIKENISPQLPFSGVFRTSNELPGGIPKCAGGDEQKQRCEEKASGKESQVGSKVNEFPIKFRFFLAFVLLLFNLPLGFWGWKNIDNNRPLIGCLILGSGFSCPPLASPCFGSAAMFGLGGGCCDLAPEVTQAKKKMIKRQRLTMDHLP